MTIATIDGYTVSLFIHISAVMIGFGSTFALSVAFQLATALDPRHLPYVHRLGLVLNRFFATPALVLVLVTGLYQVSDKDYAWDLGDFWVSATFAILIAIGGIVGGYFIPQEKKMKALAELDIAAAGEGKVVLSDQYQRLARRSAAMGTLTGLLLIAAVFLMVTKPGA
jgi:uncharacterized membrane protein